MNRVELGEALANVRVSANMEDEAAFLLTLNVQTARELGATWRDIGKALAVSHQSAWERFHAKIPVDTASDTPDD